MIQTIAIIPARSGSKSIIDKNIKSLGKHPLLAYTIAAAKLSKTVNRVIVSTNSRKYANIAIKYGAEVPFIRPDKFSQDSSIDRDFLIHAMNWMNIEEGNIPEFWVHLRPTTPLRNPQIIDEAINMFLNNLSSSSLRSGHPAPESPMKWFVKEKDFFKSIVEIEKSNLPKEMFRQTFIPNGYVDILKSSEVINNKNIHGDRMLGFISPTVTEVDSIEEFEYISYQLEKHGSVLKKYLDNILEKN